MSQEVSRPQFRFSTVALAIALLFVVAGLVAGDRALVYAERSRLAAIASRVGLRLEKVLARESAAAARFLTLFESGGPFADAAQRVAAIEALESPLGGGGGPAWIADATGVVHAGTHRESRLATRGTDLDTVSLLGLRDAVRRARAIGATEMTELGEPAGGERGMALVRPVRRESQLLGLIVVEIPAAALLAVMLEPSADDSVAIELRRAGQAVTLRPLAGPYGEAVSRALAVPGSVPWEVRVTGRARTVAPRMAMWLTGILTLAVLGLALRHDRRQARRVADRSGELEHLSSELLRANRMKSEFLANISHELRTPLNAIVGFVELLREGVYGELAPRQVGPVERIEASANHLRHLVDQILDLAKMAAGRLEVHTEIMDLRPFVLDVASEIEPLVAERGVSLSLSVGGTLPRVRTDPTHLRQILSNLLANAVKHTSSGAIAIRARLVRPAEHRRSADGAERSGEAPIALAMRAPRQDAYWVALQVTDTGIGIATTDHERIFDEFEQVNAGPRGDSMRRGTGLGLPISRRLARLLGGEIGLESELGRGSTFTLWLPVDPADLRDGSGSLPVQR